MSTIKFYPIINSDKGDLLEQARTLMEAIVKVDLPVAALELSFACPNLLNEFEAIYNLAQDYQIKIGLASLIDLKQVKALKKFAQAWLDTKLEIFAPAFDATIFKAINKDEWCSKYLEYIPGIYNQDDLNALLIAGYKASKFKIYPLAPISNEDFFKSLKGPYPGLRDYKDSESMHWIASSQASRNDVTIKTPRDYQRHRKKQANYNFDCDLRPAQSIIDCIKLLVPKAQVIISGLGVNYQQTQKLTAYDFIATRMNAHDITQYSSLSA